MAIFAPSSIVGAISGSLGGVTFVTGRRGTIVRHRPAPSPRSSAALAAQQSIFANATRTWVSLSPAQRASWRALAANTPATNRLGLTSPKNGFTLFVSVNLNALRFTGDFLEDPPTVEPHVVETVITITFTAFTSYLVQFQISPAQPSDYVQIFGSRAFSSVHPKAAAPLREILNVLPPPGPFFIPDLRTAWIAVMGEMPIGEAFTLVIRFWDPERQIQPTTALRFEGNVLTD